MPAATPTGLDLLVQLSRRNLWFALVFILLLGAGALVPLAFPDSPAALMARQLWMLLPLIIVIALAALRVAAKGVSMDPSGAGMKAIAGDDLRQASLHRAYRNGFFAMLLLQPLLAMLLTSLATAFPIAVMAGAGSLVGAVVFLGSLLYYDR